MSLKKQALSSMFWSSIQTFGTQAINFFVSIVLARVLLPEEFGLIAMLAIFIGLGNVLINSGLTHSLIRTENANEEDFSTVFYFNLLGSLVIYFIVFFSAPFISDFYGQELLTPLVRVYSIIFIIDAFSTIQITRLTKILDFKTQMIVNLPSLIIGSVVGITMAYKGFGVWSLVWSSIVKSTAASIQIWYWAKWKPLLVFNIEKFKYHFNYGVKLMFSGILDILFINAYTIIIGRFFLPSQVGFYNRAQSFQMFPVNSLSLIVTKVSYPLFSSIQNDNIRLKEAYKKIMQMIIFLIAPLLIIMSVLAEPLFRFLFTEKWLPAVPYFQILCANGILYPIHAYNLQILNVKGRSDLFLRLEVVKKILFLIVIILSFPFGIKGLLYGSVITSVLSFFINTHYSGKFINYSAWTQAKDLLPTILISIFAGTIVYSLDVFFTKTYFYDFGRLFLGGLIGLILYITITYLFKISSLKEIFHIIRNR